VLPRGHWQDSSGWEPKFQIWNRKYRTTPKGRYAQLKSSAKNRGIEFEITFEEYLALISQPCYICGESLFDTGGGVAREDHQIGYVLSNLQPCCQPCNKDRSKRFLKVGTKGETQKDRMMNAYIPNWEDDEGSSN